MTLTLFRLMEFFHKHVATYTKVRMFHCVYCWVTGYNFQKHIVFISLKIDFVFAKSADPDEMQHNAAFHLGLHCLRKYPFRGFLSTMGQVKDLGLIGRTVLHQLGFPSGTRGLSAFILNLVTR